MRIFVILKTQAKRGFYSHEDLSGWFVNNLANGNYIGKWMVSLFVFMESNGKSIVVLPFYHHNVISWTKCKATITPHIVP